MNEIDLKVRSKDGDLSDRHLREIGSCDSPTPLNRDSALSLESHRHELLDPTTLRWVADLLKDLGTTTASVAGHLAIVAETAGRAIDVRWRRDDAGPRSTSVGADGSGASDASRVGQRPPARSELSRSERLARTIRDSTKRSGGSGRTIAVATEAPRRAGG